MEQTLPFRVSRYGVMSAKIAWHGALRLPTVLPVSTEEICKCVHISFLATDGFTVISRIFGMGLLPEHPVEVPNQSVAVGAWD